MEILNKNRRKKHQIIAKKNQETYVFKTKIINENDESWQQNPNNKNVLYVFIIKLSKVAERNTKYLN